MEDVNLIFRSVSLVALGLLVSGCSTSGTPVIQKGEDLAKLASKLDEGTYYRWSEGILHQLGRTALTRPDDVMCLDQDQVISGSDDKQRVCKTRQEWKVDRDNAERSGEAQGNEVAAGAG